MTITDFYAAARWWAVLMLIGVAATPLSFNLLRRLPDRGYAFSKFIGLLVISFLFWLLATLGIFQNNLGGIILAILGLLGLSIWSIIRQRALEENSQSLLSWITENWRYVLIAELVFTFIFALWVWVRSQNPAITATEKPMEFAFLNSVGRSPSFPPLDPWMSGFSISYYYLGYVMTSVLTRLAAVPEPIGFNLAIAWLTAGSALGAYGLVFNLISLSRQAFKRSAFVFALIAAIALPLAGNLEIVLEVARAQDLGTEQFWSWLDVRDLVEPPSEDSVPRYQTASWWWWRSSRVIHEYSLAGAEEAGLEPIAEFPAFSFVLGDMHPHVLALPFAFLSLAVALGWWIHPGPESIDIRKILRRNGVRTALRDLRSQDGLFLIFTTLLLGGLSFLNTWDVFIHMFIILGAFILGRWRQNGHWRRDYLFQAFALSIIFITGAIALYLPFYLGFRSQAGPPFLLPMIMRPTRLPHFLIIFGMSLIGVVLLLFRLFIHAVREPLSSGQPRYWLRAASITAGIIIGLFILMVVLGVVVASSPESMATMSSLAADFNKTLPALPDEPSLLLRVRWAVAAVTNLLPDIVRARLPYSALMIFLGILLFVSIYLLMRLLDRTLAIAPRVPGTQPEALPFVLLLIFTASLLILGPEFVYLKDNFGQRLNTIFKFYYQAWVLFGVAALFGLDYLLRRFRISGVIASTFYILALLASLMFPMYAIRSRSIEYRGSLTSENRLAPTLDGLAYLNRYNPDEREAIEWLRENIDDAPVIVEAVGGQYTSYGRISANTGIPTLLGWPGHEYQWRGVTPEPLRREEAVERIYSSRDWEAISAALDDYGVSYVYLGSLEKTTYNPIAENLFNQYLELIFENGSVKIYRYLQLQGQ